MIFEYYKREWVELYVDNIKTRYLINRNGDIKKIIISKVQRLGKARQPH